MAGWKKIILENDDAVLAAVTASGVKFSGAIPEGSQADKVLVVDASGHIKEYAQSLIAGENTTYAADGTTILLGGAGDLTFSVATSSIDHDQLGGVDAAQHVEWAVANQGEVHDTNYTNTTYAGGTGITIDNDFTASMDADQGHVTAVGTLTTGSIGGQFGSIYTTGNISSSNAISATNMEALTLDVDTITVASAFDASSIKSPDVVVTGSLTVNGDFYYNDTTYADQTASLTEGNTIWGNDVANTHYFSGSVGVTGEISASSFTGPGGGITGIPGSSIATQDLTDGQGIADFTYNGGTAQEIAVQVDATDGSLEVDGDGLRIADGGVKEGKIGTDAVTSNKIADGAVTHLKLALGTIAGMNSLTPEVTSNILISTGSGASSGLGKMSFTELTTYFQTHFDTQYSTTTGTVSSVNATGTVNGLTLAVSGGGNITDTGTLTLTGQLEVGNVNWTGADLDITNGGTGQSTPGDAANALLSTSLGGSFSIGTAADKIIIPGNLDVTGDIVSISATNLEITDQYILIGSGSLSADVGIKFGETANKGNLLFWDKSYGGGAMGGGANDGRFAVGYNVGSSTYNDDPDVEIGDSDIAYHLAGVFSGSGDPTSVNADHIGNIKLQGGFAYIYA